MGARGFDGGRERDALDAGVAVPQQLVRPVLHPSRHVRVRRSAVRRVVLEAAVLRRVVRRGDDDAVRGARCAATVVNEDRPRDDRRGRHAIIALDDGVHVVGRQDFERRPLGRTGQRVRILAHVERTIGALAAPVVADGLGDGQDVRLGERAAQRRAPVPAGAEADTLLWASHVRLVLVVLRFEPGQVDQHLPGSRLARERRNRHVSVLSFAVHRCQRISWASRGTTAAGWYGRSRGV